MKGKGKNKMTCTKEYYLKNREEILIKRKKYYLDNREKTLARCKAIHYLEMVKERDYK